ncbi:MAG TPA: hypothetical protein VI365_34535 [Trebonia sp.]
MTDERPAASAIVGVSCPVERDGLSMAISPQAGNPRGSVPAGCYPPGWQQYWQQQRAVAGYRR